MKETKPEKTDTAICFNEPSWYEILSNNKKIVGSAQRRINGKILQHGTILIGCDVEKMCRCFNTDFDAAVKATKERVTSISQLIGKHITFQSLANALKQGFEENFNLDFADDKLTDEELAAADKLCKEKYEICK